MDDVLDEFPAPVQERITGTWAALPTEMRMQLADVMGDFSPSLKVLRGLLPLVLEHYKPAFGQKHSIAIVGPANVGKSTLYNQLISRGEEKAEVSSIP
ncbi:MAG: GTPase, partial [Anaerolineae bacterium]